MKPNQAPQKSKNQLLSRQEGMAVLSFGYFLMTIFLSAYFYLFFYSAGSKIQITEASFSGNIKDIIRTSLDSLMCLQGGYWITIRTFFYFLGMIGLFYRVGAFLLKIQALSEMQLYFDCYQIYLPFCWAMGTFAMSIVWLMLGSLGLFHSDRKSVV